MSDIRRGNLWVVLVGAALALAGTLLFLFLRADAYEPARYFGSLAILRQIKQSDAQWEVQVLRSRMGINLDYDLLVDPLSEMDSNWQRLEQRLADAPLHNPERWERSKELYRTALEEKSGLIEAFKSHNAILRNSLNFLPTAEDDVQNLISDQRSSMVLDTTSGYVFDALLSTMEYSQVTTDEKAEDIQLGLQKIEEQKAGLSPDIGSAIDLFSAHVRTVLSEQKQVNALLNQIAAVPVATRLDALIEVLSGEQLAAAAQDQVSHRYLLVFAAILAALLLFLGYWLLRSYAQINRMNKALQAANDELERRVQVRTHELQRAQSELVAAARHAGMAEIATNVLHNVGNVLNSVNISADLVARRVRNSKALGLARAVEMMTAHQEDLGAFISHDEKGKLLPGYIAQVSEALSSERESIVNELEQMTRSVNHIKEIVSTQQSYAGPSSIVEPISINELMDDALRMQSDSLVRHQVEIVKEYDDLPEVVLDKHRTLLILVNLISNAKQAMSAQEDRPRRLTLSVQLGASSLTIRVRDNGEGIEQANLTRIFAHGFTTRKDGHGFGLHSCALAAIEMDGSLRVESDGPGMGACFTLEIPMKKRGLAHGQPG